MNPGKALPILLRALVCLLPIFTVSGLVWGAVSCAPPPTTTSSPSPAARLAPTLTPTPIIPSERDAIASDNRAAKPTGSPAPMGTPTSAAVPAPMDTPTPTNTPIPIPTQIPTVAAATELSRTIPWFSSPPDVSHNRAAGALTTIWAENSNLGAWVAQMSWVGNGITGLDDRVLLLLRDIVLANPDLAETIAGYHWFADGVTPWEWETLETLGTSPGENVEKALQIARLVWIADGVTNREEKAISNLQRIARHPKIADRVLHFDWVIEGIAYQEQQGLENLADLANNHPGLAAMVAEQPWLADGMTYHEQIAIRYLSYIAGSDRSLAENVVHSIPGGLSNAYLVISLGSLAVEDPSGFQMVREQPWISDGLDVEEKAFMITLRDTKSISMELFASVLKSRFTRSTTVSLPESGEVRLWAFQSDPFPANDNSIETMERAVRSIEELLGLPFNTNDIIVLITPAGIGETREPHPAVHVGSHIRIVRDGGQPIPKSYIYHETGHYFFKFFPKWIIEGGPELLNSYIRDKTGVESINDRLLALEEHVKWACYDHGIPNLLELDEREGFYVDQSPIFCTYAFGEYFFLRLHQLLGQEAVSAALRDMHLRFTLTDLDVRLRGKDIYLIFLEHTPPEKIEDYRDLFRKLHGGPWPDANVNVVDDHGDSATGATRIQAGQVVKGALDHEFDADYFHFETAASQEYQIAVNNNSMEDIRLKLYSTDGATLLAVRESEVQGAGILLSWSAPDSGGQYIAVDSPEGSIDSYTVRIAPLVVGADDHGDEATTATHVVVGIRVHGTLDHSVDRDYFQFRAEAGRGYKAIVSNGALVYSDVIFYHPDGVTPTKRYAGGWGIKGARQCVYIPRDGEYYAVVGSPEGNSGDYTLEVMPTEECEL